MPLPAVAQVSLPSSRLRAPDHVGDGLRRMIRIGHEDERKVRQHADEAEVLDRVIGELL